MFDPYHKWLGIPKDQRPPTYYQLLGIATTEQDAEVIEEAAIRQMAHLRTYQIGPHAEDCTRLLNEIARARSTLLNPAKRKEYDATLKKKTVAKATPVVETNAFTDLEKSLRTAPPPLAAGRGQRAAQEEKVEKAEGWQSLFTGPYKRYWIIGGAALVPVLGLLIALPFLLRTSPPEDTKGTELTPVAVNKGEPPHVKIVPQPPIVPAPPPNIVDKPNPPVVQSNLVPGKAGLLRTFEIPQVARGLPKVARDVAFAPDGTYFLADVDQDVQMWDAKQFILLRTFQAGFSPSVHPLAISPDSRRILCGGATAHLWDAKTGQELRQLPHDGLMVSAVAFSPDGNYALTATIKGFGKVGSPNEGGLHLWHMDSGKLVRTYPISQRLWLVAFAADGTLLGFDGTVRVWDKESGQEVRNFTVTTSSTGAFSPDGRFFLVRQKGYGFDLFDTRTGQILKQFPGHGGGPRCLAFSADGKLILLGVAGLQQRQTATEPQPSPISLWNVETGQMLCQLEGHTGVLEKGAFSPDGKRALSCAHDRTIRLWQLPDNLPAGSPNPAPQPVAQPKLPLEKPGDSFKLEVPKAARALACAPNGNYLLADSNRDVIMWDLKTRQPLRTSVGTGGGGLALAISLDSRRVFSGGANWLWDAATGQTIRQLIHPSRFRATALSPDGKYALTGNSLLGKDKSLDVGHVVMLWDVETGQLVRTYEGQAAPVARLAYFADGNGFSSYSLDENLVRVWNKEGDRPVHSFSPLPGPTPRSLHVHFSADGRLVVARGVVGPSFEIWETKTGQRLRRVEHKNQTYQSSALSPDGRLVGLLGQNDLEVFDLVTGKDVYSLKGVAETITSLTFSHDNEYLFTSSSKEDAVSAWRLPQLAPASNVPAEPQPVAQPKAPPEKVAEAPRPKQPAEEKPPAEAVRLAVPDEEHVKEVEKTIQQDFKREYAALKKSNAERIAFAEKLLQLAADTKDNPTARYVLLCQARDLATQGGKPALALKAVEELTQRYTLDPLESRQATMTALTKSSLISKDGLIEIMDASLAAVSDALAEDQPPAATRFLVIAESAARKSETQALINQVAKYRKEFNELSKDYEQMKAAAEVLQKDPASAEANLAVGKYLVFRKGDWEKGLPLLAKGEEGTYAEVARKELANPQDGKAWQELGDLWWAVAEKESGALRAAMQRRAAHWYRSALPSLSGLSEVRITERIKQAEEQPPLLRVEAPSGEVRRFTGHTGSVTCILFSPDGKRVFSGSTDGIIRNWDVVTGKPGLPLNVQMPVHSFAFSPNDSYLAVCSRSNLKVWDLRKNAPTPSTKDPPEALPGAFWTSDTVIFRVTRTQFWADNVATRSGSGGAVNPTPNAICPSPEKHWLVTLGEGGALLYQLLGTGAGNLPKGSFTTEPASCAAFSADENVVAVGHKDKTIHLYERDSRQQRKVLQGHTGIIRRLVFSADGKRLLSASDDKTARLWDLDTGQELYRFNFHTGAVLDVAFSPDGRYAFSAGADMMVRQWLLPRVAK